MHQSTSTRARFVVGVDLGTTHSVIAFAPRDGSGVAEVLSVVQLVTATSSEGLPLLPSFLFAPPRAEAEAIPRGPLFEPPWAVGAYARRRGAEVPRRGVGSAKSWLCHPGVDRRAAILPWGVRGEGDDEGERPAISPVEASARVLGHLTRAWGERFGGLPLAQQDVVLTVPASFDESARELTLEAAASVGLSPRLLEEPQAAFYDWMTRAGDAGIAEVLGGADEARVLVCDVGGGTSDFSLLRVERGDDARPRVTRVAVGDHLLLGGDNMDLALAHACESRLSPAPPAGALDAASFAQLVASCRAAKESLLAEGAPGEAGVAVLGSGSRLVGGARTAKLGRDEARRLILDGFFPSVGAGERPAGGQRAVVALGLPYARDPAVTRHLAAFLARHAGTDAGGRLAVLFNGGVFRAGTVRARVLEALALWREGGAAELSGVDPDCAVARGAVAYGLAREGHGRRIGGGAPHGYYVGVGGGRGVCVVPRGAEPGARFRAGVPLALRVGHAARFDLYSSRDDRVDQAGTVVEVDDEGFNRLPPVATRVPGGGVGEVPVAVEGELTEVGTLELSCVEAGGAARKFRLAFQLREGASEAPSPPSRARASVAPGRADEARRLVERVFGKGEAAGREVKDLVRDLERVLGDRPTWSTETARDLADLLLPRARARRRSSDHERLYWSLLGYCLRPGFGAPGDDERASAAGSLMAEGVTHARESRVWQQFFIAGRRFAGGLDEARQTALRALTDHAIGVGGRGAKRKGPMPLAPDDALSLGSWLERVAHASKLALGGWLLERTWTHRDARLWEALGRLGARVPTYASAHYVVAPEVVDEWLDHLVREPWGELPGAAAVAVALARKTGDRARDIGERRRATVLAKLTSDGAPAEALRAVREVVDVGASERALSFGESLPVGLRLIEG